MIFSTCLFCRNFLFLDKIEKFFHRKHNQNQDQSLKTKEICHQCNGKIINCQGYFFVESMKIWPCCIYDNLSSQPILNLKYNKNVFIAKKIAQYIYKTIDINWKNYDYLVPIPIRWYKYITRGYNQSYLMAYYLSQLTSIPIKECLKKIDNSTQINKNQDLRTQGPQFKYDNSLPEKKNLLIIDDVITTGTTMLTAYNCLKKYHNIEGLVFNTSEKFINKLQINYINNNIN